MSVNNNSFHQNLLSIEETQLLYGIKMLDQADRYIVEKAVDSSSSDFESNKLDRIIKQIREADQNKYQGSYLIVRLVLAILNFLHLRLSSEKLITLINVKSETKPAVDMTPQPPVAQPIRSNLNHLSPKKKRHSTPLHLAAQKSPAHRLPLQSPNKFFSPIVIKKNQNPLISIVTVNMNENKGGDIDLKDSKGFTALQYAAVYENEEVVEAILKKGAKIDQKDASGKTALSHAALNNRINIVKLLLKNGADISNVYFDEGLGNTTIVCCAVLGYSDVVEELLKNGAKKISDPKAAILLLESLKRVKPKDYKSLYTTLSAIPIDSSIYKRVQQRLQAQSVAHSFEIEGTLALRQISTPNTDVEEIELLGSNCEYWMSKILKSSKHIHEKYEDVLPSHLFNMITETLDFTLTTSIHAESLILKRIREIKPTILLSGYENHAVVFFIWGNLLSIFDLNYPLEIHFFDQNKLTAELIKDIRISAYKSKENYEDLICDLFETLEIEAKQENDIEFILEASAPIKHLEVGNCSYANLEAVFWVFFTFNRIFEMPQSDTILSEDFDKIIKEETNRFLFIKHFNQVFHFERYLGASIIRSPKDRTSNAIYQMDAPLMERALKRFRPEEVDIRIAKLFEQLTENLRLASETE